MTRWLLLMLVATAIAFGLSVAVWLNRDAWLPDKVPIHWNIHNEPDGWVERESTFWPLMIVPLMMLGFVGLACVIPWLSPKNFSVDEFRATYGYIMGLVGLLFLTMHVVTVAAYTGYITDVGRWLVGGMLPFFGLMGNVLGKVRRNFYVGVKTPWTLASEVVWNATHRLAGWLFVAGSVLGMLLLLVGVNPLIALAPFLIAAVFPVFYSLWLYKRLQREGKLEEQVPQA